MDPELKKKLDAAFRALRKRGYIARQSFSCCSNCAGYDLSIMLKEAHEAGKALPRGSVFYHRQDAECLRETGRTMLRYGQIEYWGHEVNEILATPLSTDQVAVEVMEELERAGVPAEWDGDTARCIEIDLRGAR